MQHNTNRGELKQTLQRSLLTRGIASLILLCLSILPFAASALIARADAGSVSISGSISSSPSSGPAGATIAVSGSGWTGQTDGTSVYFGYLVGTTCSIVTDSQTGTFSSGSFQGWFRWPQSTPTGTYTTCAIIGSLSVTAGTFTVLSATAPQVTISPTTLVENQQATINASNYYPAGSNVTFYWANSSNSVNNSLGIVASSSTGSATLNITVPVTTLASGQYMIEAVAGGGQSGLPPTLFSSVNITYTAPVITPSPTPTVKPSPSPSLSPTPAPTQNPTVTATAGVTSTPTASVTPTTAPTQTKTGAKTPTPVTSGTTPTTNTTTGSGTTGSASSGQAHSLLLTIGVIGALVLLFVLVIAGLLVRRRRGRQQLARANAPPSPYGGPGGWQAGSVGMQTMQTMQPMQPMPGQPMQPMQPMPGQPMQPMQQMQQAPAYFPGVVQTPVPTQMVNGYNNGYPNAAGNGPPPGYANGIAPVEAPLAYRSMLKPPMPPNGMVSQTPPQPDPDLERMRRQAQAGLFVQPVPRQEYMPERIS